jgi:hypothetical protein
MLQPTFMLKSAALANWLGVLIMSKLLTSHRAFAQVDPLFSLAGLILILVWGLAFWAVSTNVQAMRPLLLVFVVEKLVYAANHALWFVRDGQLSTLFHQDALLGVFFAVYGINDALYALLFFFAYRATAARS